MSVPCLRSDASTLFWDGIGPGGNTSGRRFSARESARWALLGMGEPALQPLIDPIGTHPDARVREGAAEVLSVAGTAWGVRLLVNLPPLSCVSPAEGVTAQ